MRLLLWKKKKKNLETYGVLGSQNGPKTYRDIVHDGSPKVKRSNAKVFSKTTKLEDESITIQLRAKQGYKCSYQGHRIEPYAKSHPMWSWKPLQGFRCIQCGQTWNEMVFTAEKGLSLINEPT